MGDVPKYCTGQNIMTYKLIPKYESSISYTVATMALTMEICKMATRRPYWMGEVPKYHKVKIL